MCTMQYKAVAKALCKGLLQINESTDSVSSVTGDISENYSDTSSVISMCLPNEDLSLLPKFSDFQCIGRLGNGAYANVYCVQHLPSKEYLAIKMIDGKISEARQQFEVERQILFRFGAENPYMIKGYCSFHQGVGGISGENRCQSSNFSFRVIYFLRWKWWREIH